MTRYRRCWLAVTAWVVAVGGLFALGALALAAPLGTLMLLAAAGLTALWQSRRGSRPHTWRRMWTGGVEGGTVPPDVRAAAATPVVLVVCLGFNLVLGTAGTLLVLLDAVAGLPLLWPQTRGLTLDDVLNEVPDEVPDDVPDQVVRAAAPPAPPGVRRPAADPPTGAEPTIVPRQAGGLSPAELCHAWLASSRALERCTTAGARAEIVAARRRYLDALAAWDPDGFARWTASADPAGSDPTPYIRRATSHDRPAG